MAFSNGQSGIDWTLSYADTENGSYTAFGELLQTSLPSIEAEMAPAHYSGGSNYKGKKATGWLIVDPIQGKLRYLSSEQATLVTLVSADKWFKITDSLGNYHKLEGRLSKFGGDAVPLDSTLVEQSITITPIGSWTYTTV